jgi:hypothetical protein
VAAADHVKVLQDLHAKALKSAQPFADALAGFENLQRVPEQTAATQASRCGSEIPVADLVACFWSKTNRGAAQFPTYARALRQAGQQAIDAPASFFVMVEEWIVMTQPTFTG